MALHLGLLLSKLFAFQLQTKRESLFLFVERETLSYFVPVILILNHVVFVLNPLKDVVDSSAQFVTGTSALRTQKRKSEISKIPQLKRIYNMNLIVIGLSGAARIATRSRRSRRRTGPA